MSRLKSLFIEIATVERLIQLSKKVFFFRWISLPPREKEMKKAAILPGAKNFSRMFVFLSIFKNLLLIFFGFF
jgi:hypothetical protein